MSTTNRVETTPQVIYPDSDGEPMADNSLQFRWIVTVKEGLEAQFRDRPDVFVAGDMLWYPVEGDNTIRRAPDAMVIFGRPKGDRGSYIQHLEDGIAPQVVFEILSPNNTPAEMQQKRDFYQRYGVEEYYQYDPEPDHPHLRGWIRRDEALEPIAQMNGWVSPRLDVTFDLVGCDLVMVRPDGRRILSYQETDLERIREHQRAEQADQHAEQADQRAEQADQRAEQADQRAEQERQRAERLAEQLRQLGIDPESL